MSDKTPTDNIDLAGVSAALEPMGEQTSTAALREQRAAALEQAQQRLLHEAFERNQKLGLIGKIFGDKDQAPINGVGMIVFVAVVAVIFFGAYYPDLRKDAFDLVGKIALMALGFLGGLLTKRKK